MATGDVSMGCKSSSQSLLDASRGVGSIDVPVEACGRGWCWLDCLPRYLGRYIRALHGRGRNVREIGRDAQGLTCWLAAVYFVSHIQLI